MLLTSQEKPAEITATEGDGFPVRTLALSRLEVTTVPVYNLSGLSCTLGSVFNLSAN
ncbi:hypothetical protein [Nostoc sp.]|uniref:hypothetical protein n=1 Tax=Nostoc sp. TaxID=1180 RepID=UPI002FF6445E